MTTDAIEPVVVVADTMLPVKGTVIDPKSAAVDPFTGTAVDPFIGQDAHDEDNFVSTPESRGDLVTQVAPETLIILDKDKAEKAAAEAAEVEAAAAVENKRLADEAAAEAEKDGAKEQPEGQKDTEGKFIPKSRFDEVNTRRKDAERRLAEREQADRAQAKAAENAFDFDAAEQMYMQQVLDGEKDAALATRRAIRTAERTVFEASAVAKAQEVVKADESRSRVDHVIDRAYADYPVLDESNKEAFQPELVKDIDAMFAGLIASGHDHAESLQKAITTIVAANGLKAAGEAAENAAAEGKPPEEKKAPTKRSTVAEKLAAAAGQPPSIGAKGMSSVAAGQGAVKVNELSDDEFAALPPSTLAKLRGDHFSA